MPPHQPLKLLLRDPARLLFVLGPLEFPVFQPLVHQEESVPFPQQAFDPVALPSAEQEQHVLLIRIEVELTLDLPCQSVDPVPQIRIA